MANSVITSASVDSRDDLTVAEFLPARVMQKFGFLVFWAMLADIGEIE